MSHDHGHATDKPNMPSSAAFAAFMIFAGLIIAAFGFIKSMSHSEAHGNAHAASATHGSADTHGTSHEAATTPSNEHHATTDHAEAAHTEAPKEEARH